MQPMVAREGQNDGMHNKVLKHVFNLLAHFTILKIPVAYTLGKNNNKIHISKP